jgi:hypothetical protein
MAGPRINSAPEGVAALERPTLCLSTPSVPSGQLPLRGSIDLPPDPRSRAFRQDILA